MLHDSDGRKYFEALSDMAEANEIKSLAFYETSVVFNFLRAVISQHKPLGAAFRRALRNLWMRFSILRIRDAVIIIGIAPWDIRFLVYSLLRFQNRFIYHTSWPYWNSDKIPRKLGIFTPILRMGWTKILREERVNAVAVTAESAGALRNEMSGAISAKVIPHMISDAFFRKTAQFQKPFRLVFVGQLVSHKGVTQLPGLMSSLRDAPIDLTIIGDGPLRSIARDMSERYPCKWHGFISDREVLASLISECQCLISPAVRTQGWEELFGMSIVEAMACGVPCIVTDHIGPRSFISHGKNGVLVPDGDVSTMVDWILALSHDEGLWSSISRAASLSSQSFSKASVKNRWREMLEAS